MTRSEIITIITLDILYFGGIYLQFKWTQYKLNKEYEEFEKRQRQILKESSGGYMSVDRDASFKNNLETIRNVTIPFRPKPRSK